MKTLNEDLNFIIAYGINKEKKGVALIMCGAAIPNLSSLLSQSSFSIFRSFFSLHFLHFLPT